MSDEDDSILGNLPRSRPGTRSEKRSASKSAARNPSVKKPAASAKSRPTGAGGKKAGSPLPPKAPSQPARPTAAAAPPRPANEPARGPDPIGDVLRAAEALATASARVATSLAGEALRRLSGR